MSHITRRFALRTVARGSALAGSLAVPPFLRAGAVLAADAVSGPEAHGLSSFGELALPADFKHLAYVRPDAPKGGSLLITIGGTSGNQNFETFDTLNIFVLKGNGAAGMSATYDSLMASNADEPDSVYGLAAQSVVVSPDRLTYTFRLRPEARFQDGSHLTAADVAFTLKLLKNEGHPTYQILLDKMVSAEAEADDRVVVRFSPDRSRDLHLVVAGLPIFSQAYWKGRDFQAPILEAPLGSGPYKVGRLAQGSFIEFERVPNYWAAKLPITLGLNNFGKIRYDYYRRPEVAFEAFKAGVISYREENSSRLWNQNYDFPAVLDSRVKKRIVPSGAPAGAQGWYFNTRRDVFKDPRVREAIGCCFDFEWTNRTIMFSSYKRTRSYFDNSPNMAVGKPGPEELTLLEPFRDKLLPEVFGEPFVPPISDGSGVDRNLLRRADALFRTAGCKRDNNRLLLPNGTPLAFEFLDSTPLFEPHLGPFVANLRRLGIQTSHRVVDASQYKSRTDNFDFDIVVTNAGSSLTPGDELRLAFGSQAAKTPGSRNLSGISDPVVDALVTKIANAKTRPDLTVACQALDRVLRAGRYWVPMWYRNVAWLAAWDIYERPQTPPKFGTGAPETWWVDAARAEHIKVGG